MQQVLKILTARASSDESKVKLLAPTLLRLFAFCLRAATLIYDHLVHNLGVELANSRDATFRLEGVGGDEKSYEGGGGTVTFRMQQRNVVPSCIQYYRPAFLVLGSSADFYGSLSTSTRAENQLQCSSIAYSSLVFAWHVLITLQWSRVFKMGCM